MFSFFKKLNNTKSIIEKNECNQIVGIIDSKGSGGSHFCDDELWTFSFSLAVWYGDDKKINKGDLYVFKEVEHAEIKELMDKAGQECTIRITVDETNDSGRVRLIDIVDYNFSDELLEPYLIEMKKEIKYEDAILGAFTLDKSVDWFSNNVDWCNNSIKLIFDTNELDELIRMLNSYRHILADCNEWDMKVKEYAASKLLSLKNEFWLDEDDDELTTEEFVRLICIESLNIASDGSLIFWLKDGDIFYGHVINVHGNVDGTFSDADIAG